MDYNGNNCDCLSQSAFAGYGLEEQNNHFLHHEKDTSQSAFAGYGLEEFYENLSFQHFWDSRNPLSLDMGWKSGKTGERSWPPGSRNPLSLDMGWKLIAINADGSINKSQSAFAGYGLEIIYTWFYSDTYCVAIRFRWIWVGNLTFPPK